MFEIWTVPVIAIVIYLLSSIKILREYERGVIFRLGRVLPQPKGPGIFLVFAPIDRMVRTSLRIEAMEVPAQDVITRDNVTVKVNAVIYFRVINPIKAVIEVTNFLYATSQLSQTSLRSVLGEEELDTLLSQREKLNARLCSSSSRFCSDGLLAADNRWRLTPRLTTQRTAPKLERNSLIGTG